jgi:hypothetical protein
MRDSLAPEEFHGVVKDLAIDSDTVRAYVSFAKKNHAKFDNFTIAIRAAFEAALHASGALPPPRDMGVQTSHDPPKFFSWTSAMVMQFVMRWKKFLSAKPLKSWGVSEAEQFIYGLRPILKVHATVSNWIKEQQRP